jgi:hypothetical protein
MTIGADGKVDVGEIRVPRSMDNIFVGSFGPSLSDDSAVVIENSGGMRSSLTLTSSNSAEFSGTVKADGNVGIGMSPTRSTAKEQLAEWKASFDARLKAEPKADKKAVTLEITDDAFEVMPTEEAVAEWMETRAAGDKLQVNGDGFFAGAVKSNAIYSRFGSAHGISFADNSGSVSVAPVRSGTDDGTVDLGQSDRRWKDAHFSGTVTANKFVGDGSGLTGVGGGLPSGDYTHNGKITATDFISTSDERLKENITPMPIGLIDDIKPVSWEWKDGSGPSAGVVAQQLQAVGLGDYVSEDEDGQLGVNYQALTAILLAEVIELKRSLK